MRRFHVVLLLLLVVFVAAFVAVAVLASRYSSDKKKLLAARDEVLPKLQAIMEAMEKEKRPVLRGEPIPGSGAEKLDSVLRMISDIPMLSLVERRGVFREMSDGTLEKIGEGPVSSRVRWRPLFQAMYGSTLDEARAEIARAHLESMRAFLPEAREALQHESWCLLEDLVGRLYRSTADNFLPRTFSPGRRLAAAWLLEADELAGAGRRDEALRCLTDALRLGEELGPRGRLSIKTGIRESIQGAAAIVGSGLLWSHPFETEELDDLLEELSILEESQAGLRGTLEVIEFMQIIEQANAWEEGRTVRGPRGLWWWRQYSRSGFDVAEVRKRYDEQRELYLEPIQKMRQALVGALNSGEGSALVQDTGINAIRIRVDELQALARLRCLRAAAMVHRYRAVHGGRWPDALRDCGQEPLDPWDGKPLRYKPPGGGRPAYIYSVGTNLVDEGGMAERPFEWGPKGGKAHYDFIFPLGRWPSAEAPGDPPR